MKLNQFFCVAPEQNLWKNRYNCAVSWVFSVINEEIFFLFFVCWFKFLKATFKNVFEGRQHDMLTWNICVYVWLDLNERRTRRWSSWESDQNQLLVALHRFIVCPDWGFCQLRTHFIFLLYACVPFRPYFWSVVVN